MDKKKQKVLIVDDDQFLLNMYSIKFKKSGFDVETSTNGQEVLSKLRGGFAPDIVLLDVVMPAMDGLELLEKIRKEKFIPDAAIFVLSNQNNPADIERASRFGITSYIVKASSIPSEVVAEVTQKIASKNAK